MIARKRQEMAAWRIAARSSIHGQQKAYASDAGGSNGLSQSGVWFGLLAAGAVFGNYLGGFGGECDCATEAQIYTIFDKLLQ